MGPPVKPEDDKRKKRKEVDGRDKPGHDGKRAVGVGTAIGTTMTADRVDV
jgi:hypothetical protein